MSLLDHFWTLASNDPKERLQAAEMLINGLQEKNTDEDWNYALNRLTTGLSSSRGSARQGFSMALTEVLRIRADKLVVKEYLDKIVTTFHVAGSVRGAEERGLLFGKLFALNTLAKSPLWPRATAEDKKQFVTLLADLMLKKTWLRQPAGFAISQILTEDDNAETASIIFEALNSRGLAQTNEGIALALQVPAAQRDQINGGDPLAPANLSQLSRVLRELPVSENKKSSHGQGVHFVWNQLLKQFLTSAAPVEPPTKKHKKSSSASKRERVGLAEFWRSVIDEGYFNATASPERKMVGFEIFALWIKADFSPSDLRTLFSPHLVKSLANQAAQTDRTLHKMAKRVMHNITEVAEEKKGTGVTPAFIAGLIGAVPLFDRQSRTKTVADLVNLVDGSNEIQATVECFLEQFESTRDSQARQAALDSIVNVARAKAGQGGSQWVHLILDKLVPLAYFENSSIDDAVSDMAQQRLNSILSSTLGRVADPAGSWPYLVLQKVRQPGAKIRIQFDEESTGARQRVETTLDKIHKRRISSKHVDSGQLQAFELLFAMVLLQVYAGQTDAIGMLDELQAVYTKVNGRHAEDDDDESDASFILTEILVSLLSQQSALLRKLSEDVWGSFSEHVSAASIALLGDILQTQENSEGQQALFNVVDDEMEDDANDDMEDEIEEDGLSDSSSHSVAISDSDDSGESEDGVDDEGRRQLAKALKTAATTTVAESDESEESMDDEQMAALDGHLATIFRNRQQQKQEKTSEKHQQQKARKNIALLKGRVIDLFDIYITKQPSNLLGLDIVEPLLSVINRTKDRSLADKARELLKTKLCRKTDYELTSMDDVEKCLGLLRLVQTHAAHRGATKLLALACNQLGVFLAKLIVSFDPKLVKEVGLVYLGSMETWFLDSGNGTTVNMFVDLVNFLASKRSNSA